MVGTPFLLTLKTYVKYVIVPMPTDLNCVRWNNRMRKYVAMLVGGILFNSYSHILWYHGLEECRIEAMPALQRRWQGRNWLWRYLHGDRGDGQEMPCMRREGLFRNKQQP